MCSAPFSHRRVNQQNFHFKPSGKLTMIEAGRKYPCVDPLTNIVQRRVVLIKRLKGM
jgi:hypothetical protein